MKLLESQSWDGMEERCFQYIVGLDLNGNWLLKFNPKMENI